MSVDTLWKITRGSTDELEVLQFRASPGPQPRGRKSFFGAGQEATLWHP